MTLTKIWSFFGQNCDFWPLNAIFSMFTLSVSPTKIDLESWNLTKVTLRYVPRKVIKWKVEICTFWPFSLVFVVNWWKISNFDGETHENGQKCAKFNFSFSNFFGTYIRVTLAKFQLSRSIFVGGDTLNVNMEKIAFKGRKSQFWPKNDQILAKVNFFVSKPKNNLEHTCVPNFRDIEGLELD